MRIYHICIHLYIFICTYIMYVFIWMCMSSCMEDGYVEPVSRRHTRPFWRYDSEHDHLYDDWDITLFLNRRTQYFKIDHRLAACGVWRRRRPAVASGCHRRAAGVGGRRGRPESAARGRRTLAGCRWRPAVGIDERVRAAAPGSGRRQLAAASCGQPWMAQRVEEANVYVWPMLFRKYVPMC